MGWLGRVVALYCGDAEYETGPGSRQASNQMQIGMGGNHETRDVIYYRTVVRSTCICLGAAFQTIQVG